MFLSSQVWFVFVNEGSLAGDTVIHLNGRSSERRAGDRGCTRPRKICVAGRRAGAAEPVSGAVGSAMYAR